MKRQHNHVASPHPELAWQTGKTTASIHFVDIATKFLDTCQDEDQKKIIGEMIDRVRKSNLVILDCNNTGPYLSRKAKAVFYHDDPPCNARLYNGWCLDCNLYPDMQSKCIYLHCPLCDCRLKHMECPECGQTFKSQAR